MSIEAAVLRHIRDNPGITARRLASALKLPLDRPLASDVVAPGYVSEALQALQSAQLISASGRAPEVKYKIADWWAPVQRVLSISLSDLERRKNGVALLVEPVFGPPLIARSERSAFVVMPFERGFDAVYDVIHAALSSKFLVTRADDLNSSNPGEPIMQVIWSNLLAAHFIVADCTGRNPNVAYELGIAHTLGKRVLLLAQSRDDVPFDIGHRRVLFYDPSEAGLQRLDADLRRLAQDGVIKR